MCPGGVVDREISEFNNYSKQYDKYKFASKLQKSQDIVNFVY